MPYFFFANHTPINATATTASTPTINQVFIPPSADGGGVVGSCGVAAEVEVVPAGAVVEDVVVVVGAG
ncbi:MAG: hypothetical protein J7L55_00700, partial [Desulfurococcales archaeon]|nr:hypothetical protein [Desulfurococcales archaeon]